jgi:hypothetical protein
MYENTALSFNPLSQPEFMHMPVFNHAAIQFSLVEEFGISTLAVVAC